MKRILVILSSVLTLTACSSEELAVVGPNGAWWVGGDDGGVFINIMDDENATDEIYTGTIYFDHDQSIWYQGKLKLIGDIKFSPNEHRLYQGWDGERLHLINAAYLEVIEPIPEL
ncbi:MAG: hypothetical protein ACJASG_002001 [Oleiphilaceae bacterium]|jgi:hypothetical protein